jgi:hypothetical protein
MFVLGISCMKLRARKRSRDCECHPSRVFIFDTMIDRRELGGMLVGLCVVLIAPWQL